MGKNNDIRHGRHCVFKMHVHFVFVTKYRREVFTKEVIDYLRGIFAKVCTDFEAELVEFDGEDDHVHLLVNYPPKVSISNNSRRHTKKSKTRTASPSALSFPALKGEVCRAPDQRESVPSKFWGSFGGHFIMAFSSSSISAKAGSSGTR